MSFQIEKSKDALISALDDVDTRICEINCDLLEEEIIANCDTLESKVKSAFKKGIIHLANIKDNHLAAINKYRMQQLQLAASKNAKLTAITLPIANRCHELIQRLNNWPSDKEDRKEHVFQEIQREMSNMCNHANKSDFQMLKFRENYIFRKNFRHLGCISFVSDYLSKVEPQLDEPHLTLKGHSSGLSEIIFLSTGELASCCASDDSIKIWESQKGEQLFELSNHEFVYSLAEHKNGYMASGHDSGVICIWNLYERNLVKSLTGHKSPVISLAPLSHGKLASCSRDKSIKIWDPNITDANLLHSISGQNVSGLNLKLGVLFDGNLVAFCKNFLFDQQKQLLRIIDPHKGNYVVSYPTNLEEISTSLILENDLAALGLTNGTIQLVDLKSHDKTKPISSIIYAHLLAVWSLAKLPNGYLISGGSSDEPTLKIWNPKSGTLIKTITTSHNEGIRTIAVSKDGAQIASGSDDKTIKIWKIDIKDFCFE